MPRPWPIVISEVGLGRNSTISAILHDVVRLPTSSSRRRVPRPDRRHPQRFGDRSSASRSGWQHLGTETEGRQGAGREFPRPVVSTPKTPRHPHQAGRPARSDALARNVPA
ncbi:MAG: hypothetical protein ACLRM8_00500 [Alistipes sp.]